jgi:hypothetical protein
MTDPQYAYNAPPQRDDRKLKIGIFTAIVVIAILVTAGVISLVRGGSRATSAAGKVGTAFLNDIKAKDLRSAGALLTKENQTPAMLDDMKDIIALNAKHKGDLVRFGADGWFISNVNGQTSVKLSYNAHYTKGDGTIGLTVVSTPDGYRVGYVFFSQP